MKIKIKDNGIWIKDDIELPFNFDSMSDNEKWNYIFDNKLLHRVEGPAIIWDDKTEWWFLNGLRHRINGPAIVFSDGSKFWHLSGLRHRIDGPAFIWSNGTQWWYLNNKEVDEGIYNTIKGSTKEELLMYAVLPKYKDYLSLIDYRLGII